MSIDDTLYNASCRQTPFIIDFTDTAAPALSWSCPQGWSVKVTPGPASLALCQYLQGSTMARAGTLILLTPLTLYPPILALDLCPGWIDSWPLTIHPCLGQAVVVLVRGHQVVFCVM